MTSVTSEEKYLTQKIEQTKFKMNKFISFEENVDITFFVYHLTYPIKQFV